MLTLNLSWRILRPLVLAALAVTAAPSGGGDESVGSSVRELAQLMRERYVFPELGEEAAAHLEQALEEGRFDDLASPLDLARTLTESLQAVTHDLHLRVVPRRMRPARDDARKDDGEGSGLDALFAEGRTSNFGFEQVMRLPGNVGLLDLRSFFPVEHSRETAVAAMNFLANSDALIVDLRQNGGGDPATVQLLCTYLFDEPTHLNSLYWREGDHTEEYWTLDEVPGRRMPDVPVFVLTSGRTFSGAEEYAYNLQTRERAVLVGETTGGGAHPGDMFPLDDELEVFISTGRAINPVTGTNWEGTGVVPDVATPSGAAMDRALELAREAALDHRDAVERAARG